MKAMPATPGPWHVAGTSLPGTPDETCNVWSEAPPGYQSGDQVAQYVRPADAALIVAAPEMLELLRALVFAADGGRISGNLILDENSPLMDAARDVIAKATGSTT